MTTVKFYEPGAVEDGLLRFAVILARSRGQWVFCRHRQRETWECPGGHREPGEDILSAARRELREETGALEFSLRPVCVYSVAASDSPGGPASFGMAYWGEISRFGELHSEIAEIALSPRPIENWTYPLIQPRLLEEAARRGFWDREGWRPPEDRL